MNDTETQRVLLEDALRCDNASQQAIAKFGLLITSTLLRKNKDYGDTAQRRPELAEEVKASTAIRVRLSDKVARVKNLLAGSVSQVSESIADSFLDLAGYSILEVIALTAELGEPFEEFIAFCQIRQKELEEDAATARKAYEVIAKGECVTVQTARETIMKGAALAS